jgi:protein-tyrosine phosphatase
MEKAYLIGKLAKLDLTKTAIINIEQEQTLKPWLFNKKPITFEQAKKYDKETVKRLVEVIKFFKKKGKKVYVM